MVAAVGIRCMTFNPFAFSCRDMFSILCVLHYAENCHVPARLAYSSECQYVLPPYLTWLTN